MADLDSDTNNDNNNNNIESDNSVPASTVPEAAVLPEVAAARTRSTAAATVSSADGGVYGLKDIIIDDHTENVEIGKKFNDDDDDNENENDNKDQFKDEDDDLKNNDTNSGKRSASLYTWMQSKYKNVRLPRKYQLRTEEDVMKRSINSVRFTVMCSAINTKMLNPNYPIMVSPGAHPDSFPDTEPFDFNSATYFLPMCSLLGVAFASIFLGQISDKMGRKKVLLVLAWISTAGSIVKFFFSSTFWQFCIIQFVFGFFLGNLPVAMAYVGDVFTTKREKEKELGILVSFFVMGNSGGGIIAILMNDSGLFSPLWVGAAMLGVSAVFTSWYMIEAGDFQLIDQNENSTDMSLTKKSMEEEELLRPETIDQKALFNIVAGAVADNFGSTGLFPLCLSPLAFNHYLVDFINAGEKPVMTLTGYQWLSVMVAGMVVPSTLMTPYVFRKIGVAGTCVVGNLLTAVVTGALLLIGNGPATRGMFGLFVFVMYGGFPFTVFSQLTTGPMLDVIAPVDKIGYVQGLNNAAMNFGMAIAPWLFGILADSAGTNPAIIVGLVISLLAAAINAPLTCDSRFGRAKELPPPSKRVLGSEDAEFVEKALNGELVDQEQLYYVNLQRVQKGEPVIIPRVRPYAEEKESNATIDLYLQAPEVFRQKLDVNDRILAALNDPDSDKTPEEFCEMLNNSIYSYNDPEMMHSTTSDLGQWIGDYLEDTGYNPHMSSVLIKQMIMTALPPVNTDKEYTPENIEPVLLRMRQTYKKYLEVRNSRQNQSKWTFSNTLGTTGTPVFYS